MQHSKSSLHKTTCSLSRRRSSTWSKLYSRPCASTSMTKEKKAWRNISLDNSMKSRRRANPSGNWFSTSNTDRRRELSRTKSTRTGGSSFWKRWLKGYYRSQSFKKCSPRITKQSPRKPSAPSWLVTWKSGTLLPSNLTMLGNIITSIWKSHSSNSYVKLCF